MYFYSTTLSQSAIPCWSPGHEHCSSSTGCCNHPGEFSRRVPVPDPAPAGRCRTHTGAPTRPRPSAPGTAQRRRPRFRGEAPAGLGVFQAQGRFLPARLSQMETKAKFGPSPSGRARQSLCLRQRRPPEGAGAAGPAAEGRGRPEGTACSSGQRDGSGGRPGHRTTGTPRPAKRKKRIWGEHGRSNGDVRRISRS